MTIHETTTHLTPAEIIQRARSFFASSGPNAAFGERVGEGFLKLHMEVGEVIIAALPQGETTLVRGSASRGEHLLTRFLASLAPPQNVSRTTHRYGVHERQGAMVDDSGAPEVVQRPVRAAARAA